MSESDEDEEDLNDDEADNKQRKSCEFGDKCFRKNPNHRNDFAHPGDSDYQSDGEEKDVPEKNNKKDNKRATKKVIPRKASVGRPKREAAKRGAKKRTQDDEDDDLSEEEEDSNSKRKRTTARKAVESDEEQESSDEDLESLVKEAKGFVRNKNLAKKV